MNLRPIADGWLEAALSFVYPAICQLCSANRATAAEGYVCVSCRQQVKLVVPPFCERCGRPFEGHLTTTFECTNCRAQELPFCSARSAVVAKDVAREVIHQYKYQRALWFEPFLANLLISAAAHDLTRDGWDFIVPVPLHPTKEREREFNQAGRLAVCLGRATGIPVRDGWLRRVKPTRTQTQLSRDERAANVRNAFAAAPGFCLNGERIVLVDDVFTTGATTSACARVLKAAGAGDVCVWTVAN